MTMCRMSMLIAVGRKSLAKDDIGNQLDHMKRMSLGMNSIPYRYGHFTDSREYDLQQRLLHGDGFGVYYQGSTECYDTKNRAVYSVGNNAVLEKLPVDTKVSFMHARLATKGSKAGSNIQPFDLQHIVGAHNGTVAGLEQGCRSDSRYILEAVDRYFGKTKYLDVHDFEQMIIEQIVKPAKSYGAMNLILFLKDVNKIVVICSYDEKKLNSKENREYYTMKIKGDREMVFVASEEEHGDVIEKGTRVISTKNHTLYEIDRETGEIVEHHLEDLEKEAENKEDDEKTDSDEHSEEEAA